MWGFDSGIQSLASVAKDSPLACEKVGFSSDSTAYNTAAGGVGKEGGIGPTASASVRASSSGKPFAEAFAPSSVVNPRFNSNRGFPSSPPSSGIEGKET